jgi:hypothetical protein
MLLDDDEHDGDDDDASGELSVEFQRYLIRHKLQL